MILRSRLSGDFVRAMLLVAGAAFASSPYAQDTYEPDDTPDTAHVLALGIDPVQVPPQQHTITNPADQDWVFLYSGMGQSIEVHAEEPFPGASPNLYLVADLFDSDGQTQLGHSEGFADNGGVVIALTSYTPHDGIYYVRISADNGTFDPTGLAYQLYGFDSDLATPGYVTGTVSDVSTSTGLAGVQVCYGLHLCTTSTAGGSYSFSASAGGYTVSTDTSTLPAGYYAPFSTPVTLSQNAVTPLDIALTPLGGTGEGQTQPTTVGVMATATSVPFAYKLGATVNPNNLPIFFLFDISPGAPGNWQTTQPSNVLNGGSNIDIDSAPVPVSCGTRYYYRAHSLYNSEDFYGTTTFFDSDTCAVAPPTVLNAPKGTITTSTAVLNGQLNPNAPGSQAIATYQFGPTQYYNSQIDVPGSFTGTDQIALPSAHLTNLDCHTTYHYSIIATNNDGSNTSQDLTFHPAPCPPLPTVGDPTALEVGSSIVKFTASVVPNDSDPDFVSAGFRYGTTIRYGQKFTATSELSGTQSQTVTGYATGLTCGTPYYYAANATNAAGLAGSNAVGPTVIVTDCDLMLSANFEP